MGILDALMNMSTLALMLFVLGIICLGVEMFSPGFGWFGGTGIALLFAGIIMTAQTFTQGLIMAAVLVVIVSVMLTIVLRSASSGRLSKSLILTDTTDAASGFQGTSDMSCLLGNRGMSVTSMRPSGIADFDGVRLDVVTRGEYIKAGTAICVVKVEGNRIVVAAVPAESGR